MGKYFGTDGFRGEAGVAVTALHAFNVGVILGHIFGKGCRAVIGKDTRRSSYMLEYALAAGLTSVGGDAYIMHVTTTASVSYITRADKFNVGVMLTASHNPYYDNGIKLFNGQGEKLEDSYLAIIEEYLSSPAGIPFCSGPDIGRTVDYISGRNRYVGRLISLATRSFKGLKIGLDGANGSAFAISKNVFDSLGAQTYTVGSSPDGFNVNSGVGSTDIDRLCGLVKAHSLDIGFAFDGDADRCISVDSTGRVLTGDEELYVLANYLKDRKELTGDRIVCTKMSNGGLIASLKKEGIACSVCDVGDKNVWEEMVKTGAALGGERSGHIVLGKYETTGDGIVTALLLTECLIEHRERGTEPLKDYEPLQQAHINIPSKTKLLPGNIEELINELEKDCGVRLVVRPSGTESVIRIMAEGKNYDSCLFACMQIKQVIEGV